MASDQPTSSPIERKRSVATATAHLQAKREITPELARALGEMILRAQAMFPDEPDPDARESDAA